MATTSIWNVKGWLGKVVVYVENPDKTQNPKFFENDGIKRQNTQGLSDVIDYAVRIDKTQIFDDESETLLQSFVSGVNCCPTTAREEMTAVKKRYGKDEGIIAFHGYQSFAPKEATPEIAHEIGLKLAEQLWGERFQVIVATHLDKANHLHNHFVVNSVSFADGRRYYRSKKDYLLMQAQSDKLCHEYKLSVIENPQYGKGKQYGEWRAEKENRPTWRGLIKADVDKALRMAMTERQLFLALKDMGYSLKFGKDISVKPPQKERYIRLVRSFGEEYSIENIRKYILSQTRPERALPLPMPKRQQYKTHSSFKTPSKLTGFRALYIVYCFKLGIYPKKQEQSKKRIYFLYREDLRKMDGISNEAKLLAEHRIDTAEQLSFLTSALESNIEALSVNRKQLYKALRTKPVKASEEKQAAVKAQISVLSKQIAKLRKEVALCNNISIRSGIMKKKLEQAREDEKPQGKDMMKNEQLRRRSRTNR